MIRTIVFTMAMLAWCLNASASDEVTTSAEVFDGHLTRTVALLPLKPAAYLESRLESLPAMNARVVRTMLDYPRDGTHAYWWPRSSREGSYDGATTDVIVAGEVVMRGEPRARSFCCGLTLEVFYATLGERRELEDLWTSATGTRFKQLWFCTALNAPGPDDAMTAYGMGVTVDRPEEVLPGDFVQIWRNSKSGHSVIFVDWARDPEGNIMGLHYWSTQPGTKGIAFTAEIFGAGGSMVDRQRTSFTRLLPRERWNLGVIRGEDAGTTATAAAE
jgi:hypothetical protein